MNRFIRHYILGSIYFVGSILYAVFGFFLLAVTAVIGLHFYIGMYIFIIIPFTILRFFMGFMGWNRFPWEDDDEDDDEDEDDDGLFRWGWENWGNW